MSKDTITVSMNVHDIPILVETLEKANKEIERLKGALQTHEILLQSNTKEIERLNNIIKEARECINHYAIEDDEFSKIYNQEEQELLEILEKEVK